MATKTPQFITQPVTPYALAGPLNAALAEALGENAKEVSTQEMYMAVRNGTLKTDTFDSGHKRVSVEEGNRYIAARIERAQTKLAKASAPKSEDEAIAS